MGQDGEAFQAQGHAYYDAAADWLAYLLGGTDREVADGFRSFLVRVSNGERISEALLLDALGRSWEELEAGFERWR